jgi:uncharacterized protein with FMN-binding domain
MTNYEPTRGFNLIRALQKFVVSTFVVCTFIGYALHEHFVSPDTQQTLASPPAPTPTELLIDPPQTVPSSAPAPQPTATQPEAAPPPPPSPAIAGGQYKDGSYTGPEVDAFYGLVQVKAVIKNGKIANVQFLEYPNDRRTSVRINNVAVPYLQREAVQVQSANVDIISGATLTSEAFAESLQAALDEAKS